MSDSPDETPDDVLHMAEQAREYIRKSLDIEVDGTSDTLPVVDHYLGGVPGDEEPVRELAASAVGCYFGELLRARFGGAWLVTGQDPALWRLRLSSCSLSLFPVAMAYQAMARGRNEERFDDGVFVESEDREGLRQALDLAAPVPEDLYYSLCNRFDTLEYIVDILVGGRAKKD